MLGRLLALSIRFSVGYVQITVAVIVDAIVETIRGLFALPMG